MTADPQPLVCIFSCINEVNKIIGQNCSYWDNMVQIGYGCVLPSNDNCANDYDDNKEGAQCYSYNYRNRGVVIMMW